MSRHCLGLGRGCQRAQWQRASEGCRALCHACLPGRVPLLALVKCCLISVREIKIISRQIDVREQRKGGGESRDDTISHCSMYVSQGPFNCSCPPPCLYPAVPSPDNL